MSTATRMINIFDVRPEVEQLWPQYSAKLEQLFHSGAFIGGPEVVAFEAEVAEFIGSKFAVGLNSGTDALMIGLRALGIGEGDEVITTPFSFYATAESISNIGATPVFVDVEEDSMNIDPAKIAAAITPNTKAIMPVHLFGRPANMAAIMEIAKTHNLKVIEDCAQSIGARCDDGRMTGTIGEVGCFSFYPTKNLGAYGDGGLLTTDSEEIAQTARKLRDHGSLKRYYNEELGYNSRLDAIQAAILRIKLPLLAEYNVQRRRVASRYNELLAGVKGVITPEVVSGHVFHQYTLRFTVGDRDSIQARLRELGVGTIAYYPVPIDRLPVYAGKYPTFETNEVLSAQVLSLPMYPQLKDEDIVQVAEAIKQTVSEL